jgi:hypothetical protein
VGSEVSGSCGGTGERKKKRDEEKKNGIRIDGKEFLWRERELVVWRVNIREANQRHTTTILFFSADFLFLKQIERASQLVLKYQKYVTVFSPFFPKRARGARSPPPQTIRQV